MTILKVKDWLRLSSEINKLDELTARRDAIAKKWADSGILEGLKGYRVNNIAQLLESQASAMLNELSIEPLPDTFKAKEQ